MESLILATSTTCVYNYLSLSLLKSRVRVKFELFLEFEYIEEHTSGERGKKMHVRMDGKEK